MKQLTVLLTFLFWGILSWADLKTGDIIFHRSQSRQSEAIAAATHSQFTHMGVIFKGESGRHYVFEASSRVKLTELRDWIQSGRNGRYVVKRLRQYPHGLSSRQEEELLRASQGLRNKRYDIYFNWTDEEIYCSELVFKLYKRGLDIEIGELQELRDFDLSSDVVQRLMRERYGNSIPYDEPVISPASMAASELLYTVESNW